MSETDADTEEVVDPTAETSEDLSDDPLRDASDDELRAELELLREENRRLRESYIRARRSEHRRVAVGLGALGVLATLGAVVFAPVRTVLLALGATGLFSGLLTYYLTPERFVAANVGTAVYATLAANAESVVSELGLEDELVYVPVGETGVRVKLFVPHQSDYEIPDEEALESMFVVTDAPETRGVALDPTGDSLFGEFERALDGPLGQTIPDLAAHLSEALVEQFEIAERVECDTNTDRVTVEIAGDVYGDLRRFDHPAQSFIAVGLARGLSQPVRIDHADEETVTLRVIESDTTN